MEAKSSTENGRPLSPSEIFPDPNRARLKKFDTAGWDKYLKTHPAIPVMIYGPLCVYFLWQSYLEPGAVGSTWIKFVSGLLLWTLVEYGIHRGLLHHFDINALWNMNLARIHARHHEQPEDVSQVIISPAQTIPLVLTYYGILRIFLRAPHAGAIMAGVLVGYVCYESFHYAFHAPASLHQWRWLNALRKYHARHHFETPGARFGVTTPLWDVVFSTRAS